MLVLELGLSSEIMSTYAQFNCSVIMVPQLALSVCLSADSLLNSSLMAG